MTIVVTGGAGFIGSNFILDWLATHDERVVNLDKLTYAGNPDNLGGLRDDERYVFVHAGIEDRGRVDRLLAEHRPRAVVNFAAESHVDRSISGPADFIQTNLVGTFNLLAASLDYWSGLDGRRRERFRFLHVSTDEVYGSLGFDDPPFSETSPYAPNSPYSASKAGSDHLVRAYWKTYRLPVITTNCSNNYGPFQHPEKLIPVIIRSAVAGQPIPIYGDGLYVRDWLHVRDHCEAIRRVLDGGEPGESYNVGGNNEISNIGLVSSICALLDEMQGRGDGCHSRLMTFVADRPGHDRRYAIDASKLTRTLGWKPATPFKAGLRETVRWYLDHQEWVARALQRCSAPEERTT